MGLLDKLQEKMVQKVKTRLLLKWQKIEKEILATRNRNWKVHSSRVRTIRYPNLGELKLKRRLYYNVKTSQFRFLLDEKLNLKRTRFSDEARQIVWGLVNKGLPYKAVRAYLKEDKNLEVSEARITWIVANTKEVDKAEARLELPDNRMYFCTDEGFITLQIPKLGKVKIRGRVTSAALSRKKIGKKWKLLGKKSYLSLHPEGEIINNRNYWNTLKEAISKDYHLKKTTTLFGATDGASNLKTMIRESRAIHIYSKFHWKRRMADLPKSIREEYQENHKETLKNWDNPLHMGYWAESDIAHVLKGPLGKGNRIWSLKAYQNLLLHKEVRLLNKDTFIGRGVTTL